jgi:hypothetical protein
MCMTDSMIYIYIILDIYRYVCVCVCMMFFIFVKDKITYNIIQYNLDNIIKYNTIYILI